jgi:hypothetical protein
MTTVRSPFNRSLSDGGKALLLLLDQPSWTHRRVESLSFLPNGETRRSISWDFTLPHHLRIRVSKDRIAIPIATLRKGPLKRFDMRDAGGRPLPVWGADDNGELAVDVLLSGLEGIRGDRGTPELRDAVRRIVFAETEEDVNDDLRTLQRGARGGSLAVEDDVLLAYDDLAATLAESFVLVVEVPTDDVTARTILKAGYEDDRAKQSAQLNLTGTVDIDIDANGWGNTASWHLEVQAPAGLRVADLRHETWDPDTFDLTSESRDCDGASTAHITAGGVSPYDGFSAAVRFVPERSALLNPLTLGAVLGSCLLWLSFAARESISDKLSEFGASGAPLGAIVFGLPALFFALLSRTGEHELVSKVLLGPRLASLGCALSLWTAGVAVVWSPQREHLCVALLAVALTHTAMLLWLLGIRFVGPRD